MLQKGMTKLITHHKVTAPQSQSQANRAIRGQTRTPERGSGTGRRGLL